MVAFMLPHRRVCEGFLIDSHVVFPLSFEMKLAFSREEESQCTFKEETYELLFMDALKSSGSDSKAGACGAAILFRPANCPARA
jgi:hypothetical protein